jgi:hypothetical protein
MAKICAVGIVTLILHRNVFQMIVNIFPPHTTMVVSAHGKKVFCLRRRSCFSLFFPRVSWQIGEKFPSTNTIKALVRFFAPTTWGEREGKKPSIALSMEKAFFYGVEELFFCQRNLRIQTQKPDFLIVFVARL